MRKLPSIKVNKLDIGCGSKQTKNTIGMDIRDCGQEIIWDARDGLPFPDSSISEIYTCHFLEHLTNKEAIELFKEVYRVLKPKGKMFNRTPHQLDPTAYFLGHESFWNETKIIGMLQGTTFNKFLIILNERRNAELFFIFSAIK